MRMTRSDFGQHRGVPRLSFSLLATAITVSLVVVGEFNVAGASSQPIQVAASQPPVTGLGDTAPTTVPPSNSPEATAVQNPATSPSVAPPTRKPGKSTTTKKPRRVVKRQTTTVATTTIAASTVPIIVVSPPAPGPEGIGAGSAVDPSSSVPVPVGDTTSTQPTIVSTILVQPSDITTVPSSGTAVPVEGGATTLVTTPPSSTGKTTTIPSTTVPPRTPAELQAAVARELDGVGGQRSVAVAIDGQIVIDNAGGTPRLPASTQKIYVAGAALARFGPDHRFQTVVRSGPIVNGSTSELTLVAGGDPSFTLGDLRDLVKQVKSAGITSISGRMVIDDSLFDRIVSGPGWKSSFTPGESGYLNAMLIDGNRRNDDEIRADVGLANLRRFHSELAKGGVTVDPNTSLARATSPSSAAIVATVKSDTVAELVSHMTKKSDNTYAEVLLKQVGADEVAGSTRGGADRVAAYISRIGAPTPSALVDGSGLSSMNRSSALGQVVFLTKLSTQKTGAVFRQTLPIACVDGTLKSRMCGTPAANNVRAKTGSLNNVTTLTGYATTAKGRPVVFSMLFSGVSSTARARSSIDRALVLITSYQG